MSVTNGQAVSAAVTNPAFLKPDVNDYTVSHLGMQDPNSPAGYYIQSIQRYANNIAQTIGLVYNANYSAEADSTGNTYSSSSSIVSNGTNYKNALIALMNAFASTTVAGGHAHTGSGSDGAPISPASLSGFTANGQLIIGASTGASALATLSQASNQGVTITNGAGTIALGTVQDIRTTAAPTFDGLFSNGPLYGSLSTDSSTGGSNATLSNPGTLYYQVADASLVSISGINAPASSDQLLVLLNSTTVAISIVNLGSTSGAQIQTGTGGNISVPNGSAIFLFYNSSSSKWVVVGGSGGASLPSAGIVTSNGSTFSSIANGSNGQQLTMVSGSPAWANSSSVPGLVSRNFLLNSAADLWQRGTSITVANSSTAYLADQWYAQNGMGSGGVLTYSQASSSLAGSLYDISVKSSTAPSIAGATGIYLIQPLDNLTSLQLYNQTVTFSMQVKALGNVNLISLVVLYATSETKPSISNSIAENSFSINTSAYTQCSLTVSIGTTPTTSGIVAVFLSASGISSGHLTDLNNGFLVTQGMLNVGSSAATWYRAGISSQQEIQMCQRFYEKSYDLTVNPGHVDTNNAWYATVSPSLSAYFFNGSPVTYKTTKRVSPAVTLYSPNGGTSGKASFYNSGSTFTADRITGILANSTNSFMPQATNDITTGDYFAYCHWTADAGI